SKANTARDSLMACMVIMVRVNAGISLVGNVGRMGSVVGGLSRLVRLIFFPGYGLFGLANKLHGEGY
ncbi:hypothetical protein LTR66_017573, partial [Elasticomyces elasticus]